MAEIFQARLEFVWLSQICYNITYWVLPDAEAGTLQELTDEIAGIFTEFSANFATQCSFTGISFRHFDNGEPFTVLVLPTGGSVVGTGTGGSMPTQVAPVLTLTYIGVPPNRGRLYLIGAPVSNHETTGQLKAGAVATLTAMGEALAGPIAAGSGTAQLYIARPLFGFNTITNLNPVQSVSVSPIYGTQRRRRIGAGS